MDTQAVSTPTGTYLYCVVPVPARGEDGFSLKAPPIDAKAGRGAARVRLVREGDLAAVVSDAALKDYDPSRANVAAHEKVIEEVMQRSEVLPVRLGTVAGDDPEVRRFLKRQHDSLERSLALVRGRAELGLKVFWDGDRMFAEVLAEDATIRALRDQLIGLPELQTRDQRIELGRMTAEALERKRQAEADGIFARLRARAIEAVANRLLTETMVLNAAFLVDQAALQAFDAEVDAVGKEQRGRLTFKYVGPLPPYNFVKLNVPKEG
jgi:hypothetical protein